MPKFEREVEIDVPIEGVWKVITNISQWPEWFPFMDSVHNVVMTETGGSFEWSREDQQGTASIVSMEPMKRLEVLTQLGDDKDSHVFKLKPSGGWLGLSDDECKVEYTLDTLMGGGIVGNFIAGGNPKDAMRVNKALHMLRRLAEKVN